jgi:hypothetical protein
VTGCEVTLISIRQTQRPHGEALAKFAALQEKLESQPNQNLSDDLMEILRPEFFALNPVRSEHRRCVIVSRGPSW